MGELELEVTGSIGAATSLGNDDATLLLQQADVAMYSAKRSRSGWETYSAERDPNSPRRLGAATDRCAARRRPLGARPHADSDGAIERPRQKAG